MDADRSAYVALGLEPGADDETIEQAYRRLIKRFHPDRSGGDAVRAAELNRAYRELRAGRNLRDPLELNDDLAAARRDHHAWLLLALMLIAASLFLLFRTAPPPVAAKPPVPAGTKRDQMDQPLDGGQIAQAARRAAQLRRGSDEMTLARASRDCHRRLRDAPTMRAFDDCTAFDDAVVMLQDRDPLRDQGPFSELAVTGRIRGAAALLSDDSIAIDNRLQRIRRSVETTLGGSAN